MRASRVSVCALQVLDGPPPVKALPLSLLRMPYTVPITKKGPHLLKASRLPKVPLASHTLKNTMEGLPLLETVNPTLSHTFAVLR